MSTVDLDAAVTASRAAPTEAPAVNLDAAVTHSKGGVDLDAAINASKPGTPAAKPPVVVPPGVHSQQQTQPPQQMSPQGALWHAMLMGGTNVAKGADAVLGAPQRLASGTLTGGFQHGLDVATHPWNEGLQHSNEQATQALPGVHQISENAGKGGEMLGGMIDQVSQLIGHPTHSKQLLGAVSRTLAAQIVTDPLTVVPIIGQLGKINTIRKTAEAAMEGVRAVGAAVPGMKAAAKMAGRVHDSALGQAVHQVFGKRPELDAHLDEGGKAARLSIEEKNIEVQNGLLHKHADAIKKGEIPDEIQAYISRHGSKIEPDATPEQVRGWMTTARKMDTDQETLSYLHQYGGWKGAGRADDVIPNLSHDPWKVKDQGVTGANLSKLGAIPRKLGKYGVMLNPLPHGLKNVGELADLAGGPEAFGRGMGYTAKGISQQQSARMAHMGISVDYLRHGDDPLEKFIAKATAPQQALLNRLEMGYRQGLLDQLDRTMGKSVRADGSIDLSMEYAKAEKIRQALGDYRNISKFAAGLQAIGGPFVAFRMGIVPAATARSLARRPDRLGRFYRAENDLNDERHREGAPSEFTFGGPAEDAARIAFKLPDYLKSSASAGPVGDATRIATGKGGPNEAALGLAAEYIPGLRSLTQLTGFLPDSAQVGGHQVNHLANFPYDRGAPGVSPFQEALAGLLGSYFGWPTSPKRRKEVEQASRR